MAATCISPFHSNSLKWQHKYSLLPVAPPRHSFFTRPLRRLPSSCPSGAPVLRCYAPKHPSSPISSFTLPPLELEQRKSLLETLLSTILKALESLKKPTVAAVMLALLLAYDHRYALAASGGRVGGSAFHSRSRARSSSSYSSSSSSLSYSCSSSSSSYSYPSSSYSSSYSRSYATRNLLPAFAFFFSFLAPHEPKPSGRVYVRPAGGVGEYVERLVLIFLMFLLGLALLLEVIDILSDSGMLTETEKTTVLELQVGLLGTERSLQRDLNGITAFADTSSPVGLSSALTETTLTLLRNPDYCISGYSAVDVKQSMKEGEECFNQRSIEERGKFDEETLVNVNSIKKTKHN